MLVIILAHSEFLLGPTDHVVVQYVQLAMNVVGRSAVPFFLLLAGEHLGPRLLRNRAPGGVWPYVTRLAVMFVLASLFYWLVDLAKLVRAMGLAGGAAAFSTRILSDPGRLVLYGARQHLWFLVVLALVSIGAAALIARMRVRAVAALAAVLYGVGLAIGPYAPAIGVSRHLWWFEWLLQSPLFFCVGVVIGIDQRRRTTTPLAAAALLVGGLLIHSLEVYALSQRHGTSPFTLTMLVGTVSYASGTLLLALTPGATAFERFVARFAPYVPMVYLIHVFFVETLRPPRGRFPDLAVRIVLPVAATILSFGTAWVLQRHRPLSRRRRGRHGTARTADDAPAAILEEP
jgi:surface polysaccharide O-acyltransferase-like enzyme